MKAVGDDNQYGRRLKKAREAAKLTQERLAEKIGVSRVTLAKYESGQIKLGLERIETAAQVLGLPTWWFFTNSGELPKDPSPSPKDPSYRELLERLVMLESRVDEQSAATARLQARAVEAREAPDAHFEEAVRRGREQGLREGLDELRASVLDILRLRFQEIPEQLELRLRSEKDPVQLRRLIRQAATSDTLDEFRHDS